MTRNTNIRAVIFDMDGVIVDSEPLWFEAYQKVCGEYGFAFNEELDRLVKGKSNGVKLLTVALNIPDKYKEFEGRVLKVYEGLFHRKAELMPGALDLLGKLKGKYRLALATSAGKKRLSSHLGKFRSLEPFFDVLTSGGEVKRSKPHPDIFLKTAKKLNVGPEECLVVEDAEAGVAAAKAAGMKVVGLKPHHVTSQDLSKADKIVSSLSEITVPILLNL